MAGRPKIEINPYSIEQMAEQGMKVTEMAALLGVSTDTIHRNYAAELLKGKSALKQTLRMSQIYSATKEGNPTMLIWLGKQYLGQNDKTIDEYLLEAIQAANLSKDDLLELIQNKDKLQAAKPKKSFIEFCEIAGYPVPYPMQVQMMKFGVEETIARLILGARGYGKTDYVVILGVAYRIYLNPLDETTLIITKSKERNAAMLQEIAKACMANGVTFEKMNATSLRVTGLKGKDHSVSSVTIKTVTLRGRHPKRIIFDDPVTEDDTSDATRNHVEKVYNEANKLTANILLIGQPAHKYDLYAKLRGEVKTLEVPHGTIPELDHDLEAQRLAQVSEASISASYFLKVLSEGSTPFDNIKYLPNFPTGDSAVAWIDPSYEGGDYTALTIVKQYLDGIAVVGFTYKKAWNHCLDDMVIPLKKYHVRKLAFETNSLGDQPIIMLNQLMANTGIVITGRKSVMNKHSKIMAAGSYAHLIHLSKESSKVYIDQVTKYEYNAKHDDAPDSLASCLEWIGLIRGK